MMAFFLNLFLYVFFLNFKMQRSPGVHLLGAASALSNFPPLPGHTAILCALPALE